MNPMRRLKQAVNSLPIAIVLVISVFAFHRWQGSQAAKPDYDNANQPALTGLGPQPGQSQLWQVVKVSDSDTITVRADGKEDRIRFCGIDAPEVRHGDQPSQPFGEAAREKLRSLLSAAGNQVIVYPAERVPFGISKAARYGRLVAEVFVSAGKGTEEEKLLNDELVRAGLAYHDAKYSDPCGIGCAAGCPNGKEFLVQAEQEAQAQRRGVWSGNYQKPWEFRRSIR